VIAATTPNTIRARPILSPGGKEGVVDTFTRRASPVGINWYRNMSRNWERSPP